MFCDVSTLADGTTVASERMDGVRTAAVGIWLAVGSRDENQAEEGMSHFLEHMVFKGTPSRSATAISEFFDSIGAELNGFTSREYTCYYARVLDQHLEPAFEALADIACNATFPEDACVSEREVVLEEISHFDDAPGDMVHELLAEALWPDNPLGKPVLGTATTVATFDSAACRAFRRQHYSTGNVIVAAAGNVSHEELLSLTSRYLALPSGRRSQRYQAALGTPTPIRSLVRDTQQSHVCVGFHGPTTSDPDRFAANLLNFTLGGSFSSRLVQEVRERRGLAYSIGSYRAAYQGAGMLAVYAGTRPDNTAKVARLISEELRALRESGVTSNELDRAKSSIEGQLVLDYESTGNRMIRIGKALTTGGDLLSLDETLERVQAVTLSDVHRVGLQILGTPPAVAMVGPSEPSAVAILMKD